MNEVQARLCFIPLPMVRDVYVSVVESNVDGLYHHDVSLSYQCSLTLERAVRWVTDLHAAPTGEICVYWFG